MTPPSVTVAVYTATPAPDRKFPIQNWSIRALDKAPDLPR